MVEHVEKLKTVNTSVFIVPPWNDLNFTYYYSQEIFNDFGNVKSRLNQENIFPVYNAKEIKTEWIEGYNSAIYIDVGHAITDPENSVMNSLKQKFGEPVKYNEFKFYKVYFFE